MVARAVADELVYARWPDFALAFACVHGVQLGQPSLGMVAEARWSSVWWNAPAG
jgi:hypothetical protein